MKLLDTVRTPQNKLPAKKQIFIIVGIFLLGIGLGTFSKYLDHQQAYLPSFLMMVDTSIDLHNFLGRFPPWIFIAVCISVYSQSAAKAAVNVFIFFVGMVASYYLYSNFIAGFFPKSYDLDCVHCFISIPRIFMLICKRKWLDSLYNISMYYRYSVQYCVFLWLLLFLCSLLVRSNCTSTYDSDIA